MMLQAYWDTCDDIAANFPDLRQYETPEEAAKAAYEYVKKASETMGQKANIETFMCEPGERSEAGDSWWVVWEAGPHDWGVSLTLDGKRRTYAKNWYCETYYGFDLIFVEI